MMHTAKNMHQILDLALPAYDELFEEVNLEGLVENKGILYIWNDKDLKSRELEIKVRKELGVEQQLVTKHEIHDLSLILDLFIMQEYFIHMQDMQETQKKYYLNFLNCSKKGWKI